MRVIVRIILFVSFCLATAVIHAQCTTPINTFPFSEDFEANNGNWVTGGTASDWTWGAPAKPTINSAGTGQKCWVVGGLTGASYNDQEASWLQSPCFNLAGLTNPQVSFQIFWESELQYDGANLQYSTDNGNTWTVLGSENSNANCQGVNWYNYAPVQFLGNAPGWSGNIQTGGGNCRNGQGSGQWVTAIHSLSAIAGQTRVIFRFQFGSGRICNAFDGVAIDLFRIEETPASATDYGFRCTSPLNLSFTSTYSLCPTSFSWSFGDPASGAANTSTAENPTHAFSAPGDYNVNLLVRFANGTQAVQNKTIRVYEATSSVVNNLRCNGDANGSLQVSITPAAGPYTIAWNTSPVQSGNTAINVPAGAYQATVNIPNGCQQFAPVVLNAPAALSVQLDVRNEKCDQRNGQVSATVSGGTGTYNYAWTNSSNGSSIGPVPAGNYGVTITDQNGCRYQNNNIEVLNIINTVTPDLGANRKICPGQQLILNPGSYAQYEWQDLSTNSTFTVTQTGDYWVNVTDADGCKGTDTVNILVECREVFFPSAFTPDGNGLNDSFGPLGDVGGLTDYQLTVFNRWGQKIFESQNPLDRWNGQWQGKIQTHQSFVWVASFKLNGQPQQTRQGFVMIIR